MRTTRRLCAVLASLVTTSLMVSCGSSSTAPTTAPGTPTGVTAQSGAGQVTIIWTGATGATSYNIYWSTTTGVTPANGTKIPGATSPYVQTGLTNGTAYYYVVTGVNANGEGSASTQVSATPLAVPAAPTGVTAAPGNAQVTINWTAVAGATQYNIYWSTTTGVTPASGTKIIGATAPYVHTGLTNGTAYYYVVTALNTSGEGPASSQATATPQPAPAAPTGVTATPGNTKVTIAWTAVTGATSYNIYWSTTTGVTPANGTKIAGATSPYIQNGLTNATAYYYVVTAVDAFGEGAASSQATATPGTVPAAPTGVTATPGNTKATIAWTAVAGATSYNIYWSTTTGVTPTNGTKIAGVTSPYVQSGLSNGTAYFWVVTAIDGFGEGSASSQASTTPGAVPAAPTGVNATPGSAQVTIAWTAVTGATSYNIYWSTTTGVTPTSGTKIANATNPYVQTGLTNGTAYYYVVTAVDGFGEGAASSQATATPAAASSSWMAIAAGGNHTCALATSPQGAAYCWGYDYNGQIGNGVAPGSVRPDSLPLAVSGGLTFASIAAGDNHTCALTSGGTAYCWGYNASGELGNNTTNSGTSHASDVPAAVAGGLSFASISAGETFTCGVTTTGVGYCWGYDAIGLLGDGTSFSNDSTPQAVTGGTNLMAIGAGSTHACALTKAGAALCWGSNTEGELGNGGVGSSSTTPVAVSGSHVFTAISVGDDHTCALTSSGAAYCWGDGGNGELGNGGTSNSNVPAAVSGGLSFASIAAGADYTCAVTSGGAGYCWGAGSLGTAMNAQYTVPTAVAGGLTFSAISADVDAGFSGHACGVTTGKLAYCWGSNAQGQLGNGTTTSSQQPTIVSAHP